MLLDLSAAFDTVDHSILMEVLRRQFGVEGNALGWLAEFLRERSQVDRVGESEFDSLPLHLGVLQGSVLGPKRFIEYTEDVDDVFVRHSMRHHLFADDMQGFGHRHRRRRLRLRRQFMVCGEATAAKRQDRVRLGNKSSQAVAGEQSHQRRSERHPASHSRP